MHMLLAQPVVDGGVRDLSVVARARLKHVRRPNACIYSRHTTRIASRVARSFSASSDAHGYYALLASLD